MRPLLLCAALLLTASGARAALASNGGQTLRRLLSSRAAALGGAMSAMDGGLDSLSVNPAGLAGAKAPEAQSTFNSGVLDDVFGFLGYVHPVGKGALAGGLTYYDAGPVEIVELDGSRRTVTAQRDYVGTAGGAVSLPGGLTAGAVGKLYNFTLGQSASASGFAGDAGARWASPVKGLSLGAALQNMGPAVKFESQSDPLPLTARAGAAWTFDYRPAPGEIVYYTGTRVTVTADAVKVRDEEAGGAAGAEFVTDMGASTSIALRAAYAINKTSDGLSFGVGLREGRFVADYAFVSKRDLGSVHGLTLGARF